MLSNNFSDPKKKTNLFDDLTKKCWGINKTILFNQLKFDSVCDCLEFFHVRHISIGSFCLGDFHNFQLPWFWNIEWLLIDSILYVQWLPLSSDISISFCKERNVRCVWSLQLVMRWFYCQWKFPVSLPCTVESVGPPNLNAFSYDKVLTTKYQ